MFILEITTTNMAFHPDPAPEVVRLLRAAAEAIEERAYHGTKHALISAVLRDDHGNRVGHFRLTNGGRS